MTERYKPATPIYLDYAATTPVDPRVAEVMTRYLTADSIFANPGSAHAAGREAREHVEKARALVAALINAAPQEIIFTSGATESDNLALKGTARFHRGRGRHIVTSRTEHKAVLDSCRQLEDEGFEVTYLVPGTDGLVTPQQVAQALRDDTVLVSLMHVNNEIGVVIDTGAVGALCRERGVVFHVDAAQSAGKVAIDVDAMCADLMSFSAHKVYGPKGIGALYVREGVRLDALMHGGGQERDLRSGTLATHQICGMGEAFRLAALELEDERARLAALRERFMAGIASLDKVIVNGHRDARVPGIANLCFTGVAGESLLFALRDLSVSSGAACMTSHAQGSYVLRALGRTDYEAQSSVRFSFGRFTTEREVDCAAELVCEQVTRLRALAPA